MASKGKKFDTWKIKVRKKKPATERVSGHPLDEEDFTVEVLVPVKMFPAEKSYESIHFGIDFKHGEHRFNQQREDINELRKEVTKWLESVTTFEWEDYFYVSFGYTGHDNDGDRESEESISCHLTFRRYQVATNHEGKKVYRDLTRYLNSGNVTQGEPGVGAGSSFRDDYSCDALVKATPEAEKVLNAIKSGYRELSEKMSAFLSPDGIEGRIAAAADKPLLTLME